jgi:sugar-specific transcriptional regulator TrmB
MIKPDLSSLKLGLREIGLTEYETAAYAALLARSQCTAEDIAKEGRIPITRVYDTLQQLVAKGFAGIVPGRPKRYRATPPDRATNDYLGYLRRNFDSSLENVRTGLRQIQQTVAPMYWQSHLEVKPEQLIEPIEDLREMETYTRALIQRAEKSVLISTALFTWLPRAKRELLKALDQGASVRILMHSPSAAIRPTLRAAMNMSAQVRETRDEWYPVRGTLADERELVFVIWASEEPERFWYPKVYQPHRTKNPGLLRLFRESFEYRWSHARPTKRS